MSLIDRQAAIDAIRKHELVDLNENRRWYNHGLLDAKVAVLALPSAQQENPTMYIEGLPQINEEELAKIMKRMSKQPIMHLPSAQPIVRCKDCKNRGDDDCPMRFIEWVEYDDDGYIEYDDIIHDYTKDDGFCDRAERRTDE